MKFNHLFGPVPSRRLGLSLGVDLVPHKICSLNCIYCESGATNNLTLDRKEYIKFEEIISELKYFISENPEIECITFSGAGEPTLNSRIGDVINHIKTNYPEYRLALITNGTLLWDPIVQDEIKQIDLLLPSLDAVSEDVFKKLNRPSCKLEAEKIIQGLADFKKKYSTEMWLEVFLMPDLNDSEEEILKLVNAAKKINPDKVQLNTLDRPGVVENLTAMSRDKLEEAAKMFRPLNVEIIAKVKKNNVGQVKKTLYVPDAIISTVKRRPCTAEDLQQALGVDIQKLNAHLEAMVQSGTLEIEKKERGVFYKLAGFRN